MIMKTIKKLIVGAAIVSASVTQLSTPSLAQSLYAPNGKYLGEHNSNPYDSRSTSNPYGRYGSPYSPDSINNPYGRYGSPYSPDSVNNPFRISPSNPLDIKRK